MRAKFRRAGRYLWWGVDVVFRIDVILGLPAWWSTAWKFTTLVGAALWASRGNWSMWQWLLVAAAIIWLVNGVFWFLWRKRFAPVWAMRRLLLEAAERAEAAEHLNPWRKGELREPAILIKRIEDFVDDTLAYNILADFEDFKRIYGKKHGKDGYFQKVPHYLYRLADTLAWRDIDVVIEMPSSFEQYVEHWEWPKKPNSKLDST